MIFLVIVLLCMTNYVIHADIKSENKAAYGIFAAVVVTINILSLVF